MPGAIDDEYQRLKNLPEGEILIEKLSSSDMSYTCKAAKRRLHELVVERHQKTLRVAWTGVVVAAIGILVAVLGVLAHLYTHFHLVDSLSASSRIQTAQPTSSSPQPTPLPVQKP